MTPLRKKVIELEKIKAELLQTLKDNLKSFESTFMPWWISRPNNGGFDLDKIKELIKKAEKQ